MKHITSKLLSLLLCLAMLMSMVPVAYAVDETEGEPEAGTSATEIDLDTFIKNVVAADYDYDGGGITVKWSPATGCSQLKREHTCTAGRVEATGNTPSRANSDGYAQYQLFKGDVTDVTIKNVNFVYEPGAFTLCANTDWRGTVTETIPAEFQFENIGSTSLINCSFEKIGLSIWSEDADTTALITGCTFSNVNADQFTATSYGDYAIHYIKNGKIYVSNNKFENVCRGLMVYAPNNTETYIANNDFSGVADGEAMVKVDGTNTKATIVVSGNTDTSSRGTVCRILQEVTVHAAENDNITFTSNSIYKESVVKADAKNVTVAADGTITAVIESGTTEAYVTVNGGTEKYATLEAAIAAEPDEDGVITYAISGKVEVTNAGWIQVAKVGLTGLTKVEFVGASDDAEICIVENAGLLADQNYDIDVSFANLILSKKAPGWVGDMGHAANYFTCWLRNTDAANNTVTYTNCTFPNGACNNQYGKTVYDNCQFTNSTTRLYNLWNYGGNTEIKNSTFTGTRGIKTYNEETLAAAPTVKVENTKFDGLTEKAAIVVSKATDVTLENVGATGCGKGLLQKDIEGSTEAEKVTITANGTGIGGIFNVNGDKGAEKIKEEFNITAGTFTNEVSEDYLADGFTIEANTDAGGNITYGVQKNTSTAVAKVGDAEYTTLEAALVAANGTGTVTLLTATTELIQELLDGQHGSIDGLTIELPTGDYGQLELGRATKYAGSNTEYFVGGFDSTATNYQAFTNADEIQKYKEQRHGRLIASTVAH